MFAALKSVAPPCYQHHLYMMATRAKSRDQRGQVERRAQEQRRTQSVAPRFSQQLPLGSRRHHFTRIFVHISRTRLAGLILTWGDGVSGTELSLLPPPPSSPALGGLSVPARASPASLQLLAVSLPATGPTVDSPSLAESSDLGTLHLLPLFRDPPPPIGPPSGWELPSVVPSSGGSSLAAPSAAPASSPAPSQTECPTCGSSVRRPSALAGGIERSSKSPHSPPSAFPRPAVPPVPLRSTPGAPVDLAGGLAPEKRSRRRCVDTSALTPLTAATPWTTRWNSPLRSSQGGSSPPSDGRGVSRKIAGRGGAEGLSGQSSLGKLVGRSNESEREAAARGGS